MTPLCEVLGITINELLNGENIAEQEREARGEKQIMDLLRERQTNKRKIWWQLTIAIAGVLVVAASIILTAYLMEFNVIEIWHGVLIIIFGVIIFIALFTVAISIAVETGSYECTDCHHRFVPTAGEYIKGIHTITKRKLKCPNCGKTTWCKQRLNK